MSHYAPSITSYQFGTDGSLHIEWEVDSFFDDSEAPDKCYVSINGEVSGDLGGDARSVDIPAKDLSPFDGQAVTIGVIFSWPGETKTSYLPTFQIGESVSAPTPEPPAKPTITITGIWAQTLQHPNQIRLHWASSGAEYGQVIWGPTSPPQAWSEPQQQAEYGDFTTDRPLAPANSYSFTVQAINYQGSNKWIPTTVTQTAAVNYHFVRAFLAASGVHGPSLRSAIGTRGSSLRQIMGI